MLHVWTVACVWLLARAAECLPPRCRYTALASQAPGPSQGELVCACRHHRPDYSGNLNFLKEELAKAERRPDRTVDILLRNCSSLQLELNFNTLAGWPLVLRVEDTAAVRILAVELAGRGAQALHLERVDEVRLQGAVACPRCEPGAGLLNIQVKHVGSFWMSRLAASAPVKLTANHLERVTIEDSTFQVLPWPGIFFYNATSVLITRNRFERSSPRSISISGGRRVEVSHNLLDVAEVLKVDQYDLMVVKCNRAEEGERLEEDCGRPPAPATSPGPPVPGPEAAAPRGILVTVLAVSDTAGLLWVLLAVILTLVFLASYGLHSCCRRRKQPAGPGLAVLEELLTLSAGPAGQEPPAEEDRYSNSSRAHLAHGGDPSLDPLLLGRPPQYVRVQGVRAEPGENGVVCGSLTLGPTFGVREASEPRTLTTNILKKQTFSKV